MTLVTGGLLGPSGGLLTRGLGIFSGPSPPAAVGRDWDILVAIEQALQNTGAFSDVQIGATAGDALFASDQDKAVAVIIPGKWEVEPDSGPEIYNHTGEYEIAITVREQLPRNRILLLHQLQSVVQNTLNEAELGGFTFVEMNMINEGVFGKPEHPNQTLTLSGSYEYQVDGPSGHDESERPIY
jgi:hypothetical protein